MRSLFKQFSRELALHGRQKKENNNDDTSPIVIAHRIHIESGKGTMTSLSQPSIQKQVRIIPSFSSGEVVVAGMDSGSFTRARRTASAHFDMSITFPHRRLRSPSRSHIRMTTIQSTFCFNYVVDYFVWARISSLCKMLDKEV